MPNSDSNDTSKRRYHSGTQHLYKPSFPSLHPFSPVLLPLIITMCLESTLSHFIVECPATCELCAHWLPNHAVSTTLPSCFTRCSCQLTFGQFRHVTEQLPTKGCTSFTMDFGPILWHYRWNLPTWSWAVFRRWMLTAGHQLAPLRLVLTTTFKSLSHI